MRTLTEESFAGEVAAEGVHLVEFGATWCGPCRMLEPVLEQLERELPALSVARIDVDAATGVARDQRIMSTPTLQLYRDGELVAQAVGSRSKGNLIAWLEPHL